ncbi:MAG: translation initiation factor 2, partial [Marinosulfonomonas sp.]|nr:translation initiation factor 2 [Marinosulfonomonas sp.]
MKPNFALDLSHEGIGLLHRGADGWHTVGQVSLDDTEFTEKLGYLRQTAAALESGGVTTKLVIPNSQILFKTVEAKGPSEAERNIQIRAALDGTTPYEVDDLVYDWSVVQGADNGTVRVAAVARETLAEAEAFASEHGFNPLSFVAIPENGLFSKAEPFFGVSKSANALLEDAQTVERDSELIRVLGPVAAPEPAAPEPVVPAPVVPAPVLPPKEETAPEPELEATSEQAQTPSAPVDDDPDETPADAPDLTGIISAELPELDAPTEDTLPPAFSTRRDSGATATTDQTFDRIEKIESRLAILPEGTTSLAPKLGGVSRKVTAKPEPETPPPPPNSKSIATTPPPVTIAPSGPAAATVTDSTPLLDPTPLPDPPPPPRPPP